MSNVRPNMQSYRWVCHVCEATNAPESVNCTKCGFPANASGAEIDATVKNLPNSTASQTAHLTSSQKTIGVIGFCLAGVGAFMGRFGFPYQYNLIGLALMAIGLFGLFALWFTGIIGNKKPNPTVKRDAP